MAREMKIVDNIRPGNIVFVPIEVRAVRLEIDAVIIEDNNGQQYRFDTTVKLEIGNATDATTRPPTPTTIPGPMVR